MVKALILLVLTYCTRGLFQCGQRCPLWTRIAILFFTIICVEPIKIDIIYPISNRVIDINDVLKIYLIVYELEEQIEYDMCIEGMEIHTLKLSFPTFCSSFHADGQLKKVYVHVSFLETGEHELIVKCHRTSKEFNSSDSTIIKKLIRTTELNSYINLKYLKILFHPPPSSSNNQGNNVYTIKTYGINELVENIRHYKQENSILGSNVIEKKILLKEGGIIGINWDVGGGFGWGKLGFQFAKYAFNKSVLVVPLRGVNVFNETKSINSEMTREMVESNAMITKFRVAASRMDLPFLVIHPAFGYLDLGDSYPLRGKYNVVLIFMEHNTITNEMIQRAKNYDVIFVGSYLSLQLFRFHGFMNSHVLFQGVDTNIFFYQGRRNKKEKKFYIFSGGKLEFRKGQDIVMQSFIEFRKLYPEAHLLVNWENSWPSTSHFHDSPYTNFTPSIKNGKVDIKAWMSMHGLPDDSYTVIPVVSSEELVHYLRISNVALFPNRAEGGNNLVAMEALASGVPTIISANTGHLDLIYSLNFWGNARQIGCYPLWNQGPVKSKESGIPIDGLLGWGESNISDIIFELERVFFNPEEANRISSLASKVMREKWSWDNAFQEFFNQLSNFEIY